MDRAILATAESILRAEQTRRPPRDRIVMTLLAASLFAASVLVAAPVPAVMKPATPPKSTVELRRLRPGVWIHTSHYVFPDGSVIPANGMVVKESGGLVLIDTAWGETLTAELLDEIEQEIKLPVRRAIVTHSHADRIAGADLLRQRGIPVYAHPLTVRSAASVAIAMPTDSLPGLRRPGDAEWLGSVEIFYPGPAHTPDNIVVWVPSARVLFGGCAVKAVDSNLGNLADADVRAWPDAIHRVMERYPQAEVIVPGHNAEGGQELLTHTLELLKRR